MPFQHPQSMIQKTETHIQFIFSTFHKPINALWWSNKKLIMHNKVFGCGLFQLMGVIIEEQLIFFASAVMCHMFPDNRQFDYHKSRSKIRL